MERWSGGADFELYDAVFEDRYFSRSIPERGSPALVELHETLTPNCLFPDAKQPLEWPCDGDVERPQLAASRLSGLDSSQCRGDRAITQE